MKEQINLLLVLLLFLVISGCSTTKEQRPTIITERIESKQTVNIDKDLLKPCSPLPIIELKSVEPAAIIALKGKETLLYTECALRHKALVDIVTKAFNIKVDESK